MKFIILMSKSPSFTILFDEIEKYARHIFSNSHLKDKYFPDYPQPPLPEHSYNLTLDLWKTEPFSQTLTGPLCRSDIIQFIIPSVPLPDHIYLYIATKIECSPYRFPGTLVDINGFVHSPVANSSSFWYTDSIFRAFNNDQGCVNVCTIHSILSDSIEFSPLSANTFKLHSSEIQSFQLDHLTVITPSANSPIFYNPSFIVEYLFIDFRLRRI